MTPRRDRILFQHLGVQQDENHPVRHMSVNTKLMRCWGTRCPSVGAEAPSYVAHRTPGTSESQSPRSARDVSGEVSQEALEEISLVFQNWKGL